MQKDNLDVFNTLRERFLREIASTFFSQHDRDRRGIVIVTHLLPDRPVLLQTIREYCRVEKILSIPYSANRSVIDALSGNFSILEPSLYELLDGTVIVDALCSSESAEVALLEIGGYGAPMLSAIKQGLGERFRGVIEGTEAGRSRYSQFGACGTPIIAMSLSPIKAAESALVGDACLFSVERVLRSVGFTNEVRAVAVLGYGRIGQSTARSCRARGMEVLVYDTNIDRRVQALAEGYLAPGRDETLKRADLVLAATGARSWAADDAAVTQNGAIFASCSSKDVEFDVSSLKKRFRHSSPAEAICAIEVSGKKFWYLYDGQPINFRDGANLGPVLTLIQGELIAALSGLFAGQYASGVQSPAAGARRQVLEKWFETYVDSSGGWYKQRTA